jgi:hypothetical protein
MRPFANMKIPESSLVKVCLASWLLVVLAFAQGTSPVPQIANPLVPTAVTPGSPAFTLTVNGTGFVSGSTVYWNGSPRTTTYVSAAQITAAITAADVATATSGTVTVHQPSGVVSAPAYFLVTTPVALPSFGALEIQGIYGNEVLSSDLNGDGNTDIVVNTGNSILVANGNGDGSIQVPVSYPLSSGDTGAGIATVVGDFNNDGFPDVAVSGLKPASMEILLNSRTGAFPTSTPFFLSTIPEGAAAADLNGDGTLDLIFSASLSVGIALGNGDGSFQPPTYFPLPSDSYSITIGDFNRDGIPDIAANISGYGGVSLLLGRGDGTFEPQANYGSGQEYDRLQAADLNGDGYPDLIGADANENTFYVLLNAGDGTLLPSVTYQGPVRGYYFEGIALGDLNGDGKLDVVLQNAPYCFSECIEIFPGNGDGTLQAGVAYGIGESGEGPGGGRLSLADFNHDGRLDIATPGSIGDYLMVQTTDPAPTIAPGVLSYPSQAIGSQSLDESVSLRQPGLTTITINSVTATGDFLADGSCVGYVLQPGTNEYCNAGAYFVPTATGLRTGSLIINTSGGTQYVYLSGTGTAALNLSVTPSSINFGTVGLETTSYTQYVYLTNIGSQTVNLNSVTLAGANPGDFIVSNPCASSLNVGASCTVKINFKPTAAGVRSATLSVADNATNSPQTVALSGTGNALHVSEYLLNYGNVTVGTSSSQVLTLRNLGTRTISVGQFKFVGYAAADYSQTNTCGGGIPARSNCTITVTFTPQTQGLLDSVLSFSTNGTGTQAVTSISLKGRGQ